MTRPPVTYAYNFVREKPTDIEIALAREHRGVAHQQALVTDSLKLTSGAELKTLHRWHADGKVRIDSISTNTFRRVTMTIYPVPSEPEEFLSEDDLFISGVIMRPELFKFTPLPPAPPQILPPWLSKHNLVIGSFCPTHDCIITDRPDIATTMLKDPPKSDEFQGLWRAPQLGVIPVKLVAPEPLTAAAAQVLVPPGQNNIFTKQNSIAAASAVPATLFSGLLAVAVQAIYGIGTTKMFPPSRDQLGLITVPDDASDDYFDYHVMELRPNGVRVFYDWKFEKTHGIVRDKKGDPWLIEISKGRGVLAMRCPVFPIEKPKGEKIKQLLSIVGGFPTGQSYPDDITSLVAQNKVFELLAPSGLKDFYENAAHSEHCGWAFSATEQRAVNTCHKDAKIAYMYEVEIDVDLLQAKLTLVETAPLHGFANAVKAPPRPGVPDGTIFTYTPPRGQRLEVYFTEESKNSDNGHTVHAANSVELPVVINGTVDTTWDGGVGVVGTLTTVNSGAEVDAPIYAFYDRKGNRVEIRHYDAVCTHGIADLSMTPWPRGATFDPPLSGTIVNNPELQWLNELHDPAYYAATGPDGNSPSTLHEQVPGRAFLGAKPPKIVQPLRRGAYIKCNTTAPWAYQFDFRQPLPIIGYDFVSVDCAYALIPAKCREGVEFGFLMTTLGPDYVTGTSPEAGRVQTLTQDGWEWEVLGGMNKALTKEQLAETEKGFGVAYSRYPVNSYRFLLSPVTHADFNSMPKGVTMYPAPIAHKGVTSVQMGLRDTTIAFPPAPLKTVKLGSFAASYTTFGTRKDYKQRAPGEDNSRDTDYSRIRAAWGMTSLSPVIVYSKDTNKLMYPAAILPSYARYSYQYLARDTPELHKNALSMGTLLDGAEFNNLFSFVGYC